MTSKRPSGATTSRNAASIGPTLGASLWAGSTIEKSGGGAANIASLARPHYAAAWAPPQRLSRPLLGGLLPHLTRARSAFLCRLVLPTLFYRLGTRPRLWTEAVIGLTPTSRDQHDRAGRHRRTRRVPRPARRLGAPTPRHRADEPVGAPSRSLDHPSDRDLPEPAARSRRGSRARQGVAARLLETSAAALVDRGPQLSPHRNRRRTLSARAARRRHLLLRGLQARTRGDRRTHRADRRARARRHALLQLLGREVRPRPGAAAVLGFHRLVLLSRAAARTSHRLGAGGRLSRRRVLVEIRGLRARRGARPVPAHRSDGAPRVAHRRALCHGTGVYDCDRTQCVVARARRISAVPICRRARAHGGALVSIPHLSAAMERRPASYAAADARAARAALSARRKPPGARRRCHRGIQPPLCRDAGAWPVPGDHCGRGRARAARGRDVGLSAVVVRAT